MPGTRLGLSAKSCRLPRVAKARNKRHNARDPVSADEGRAPTNRPVLRSVLTRSLRTAHTPAQRQMRSWPSVDQTIRTASLQDGQFYSCRSINCELIVAKVTSLMITVF